jgi:hypothetical protein
MDKNDAVNDLIARVLNGQRLNENEVAEVLCSSRDLVLLSIANNVRSQNFEDQSSVELVDFDKSTGRSKKEYKRRDMLRVFNVLQNAVERHRLTNKSDKDPLAAMQSAWQAAIDRSS